MFNFPSTPRLAFGGAVITASSYGLYALLRPGKDIQSSFPILPAEEVPAVGSVTFKDKYPNVKLVGKTNGNWNSNIKKLKQKFLQENIDKIIEEFGESNLDHAQIELNQYPKRVKKWKNDAFKQFLVAWCYGSEDSTVDSVHSLMYEFCVAKTKDKKISS